MAILSSDRLIDFSRAGVWYGGVKGIPAFPVGNVVSGADPTGATDARAIIQTALNNRTQYQATLLPSGIYYLSNILEWQTSGTVLRGEVDADGNPLTTLVLHATSAYGMAYIHGTLRTNAFNWTGVDVVSGAVKGSTQIVVTNASGFSIGQGIGIDQLNDSSFVSLNGGTYCGRYSNGTRLLSESLIITDIQGNTITVHRPLYFTYNMSLNPQVFIYSTALVQHSGIENIRLTYASGLTDGNGAMLRQAAFCWVKNCEGVDTPHKHVALQYQTIGCEVRKNYLHGATAYGGDHGYGVFIYHNSDDNLVEDNIMDDVHNACISESSCCGNVIAYNHCPTTYYVPLTWMMEAFGPHAPHAYMNLYEGNISAKMFSDYYFGSNSHITWMRNLITLKQVDAAVQAQHEQAIQGLEIMAWNRYENVIGNVIGHAGYLTTYPIPTFTCAKEQTPAGVYPFYNMDHHPTGFMIGSPAADGPFDALTVSTMIRHGNYDYFSGAVEWDPLIADHDIPDSYYLASKPGFFGGLAWPAIGPDVAGYFSENGTPAYWRYNAARYFADSPGGTLPGGTNILFDKGRQALLEGSIHWLTDDIKAVAVDHAVHNPDIANDQYLADIDVGARLFTTGNLSGKTSVGGVGDADDTPVAGVSAGLEVDSIVLFKDTGNPATSPLIAKLNSSTGLIFITNGASFNIVWPNSATRIFVL